MSSSDDGRTVMEKTISQMKEHNRYVGIWFLTAQLLFLPLLIQHLDFFWGNHLSWSAGQVDVYMPAPHPPLAKRWAEYHN